MGWQESNSGDGDYDNVRVTPNTYGARFEGVRFYENDDGESRSVLQFAIEHPETGEEETVPFFAPAKVSFYEGSSNSKIVNLLSGASEDDELVEALYQALGQDGIVPGMRFVVEEEDDQDELESALQGVLAGKEFTIVVDDMEYNGEVSSVVDKILRYTMDE